MDKQKTLFIIRNYERICMQKVILIPWGFIEYVDIFNMDSNLLNSIHTY